MRPPPHWHFVADSHDNSIFSDRETRQTQIPRPLLRVFYERELLHPRRQVCRPGHVHNDVSDRVMPTHTSTAMAAIHRMLTEDVHAPAAALAHLPLHVDGRAHPVLYHTQNLKYKVHFISLA